VTYAPPAACLTQITHPSTYGGVPHIEAFTYGYKDGQLTSSTDQNGQTTSYKYGLNGDLLDRLGEIDYPEGGKTTYTYQDSYPPSVTSKGWRDANSADNIISKTIMDGLGHVTQTQLQSASEGTVYVDSTYDGLGRLLTVSNPHLSSPSPSDGTTCYGVWSANNCVNGYDALGHPLNITHPDNSVLSYSYKARATQVVDEGNGTGNVTRITQSDALGRLQSVCEVTSVSQQGSDSSPAACGQDIAGTGFLTSYQYDGLDNLTDVHQSNWQQDRQFT
jgi:YD repeat-containing protein